MKVILKCITILLLGTACYGQSVKIIVPVRPLQDFSGEIVSQIKLAKEYYMTSLDTSAGRSFFQRTENLSKAISQLFTNFESKRTLEYQNYRVQFSDSDKITGKHTYKTSYIKSGVYTFISISRTTDGDWKGGPTINGVDRSSWFKGDIPGGSVDWTTGGHREARTEWKIQARYADDYITGVVTEEMRQIKLQLNALNLPSQ